MIYILKQKYSFWWNQLRELRKPFFWSCGEDFDGLLKTSFLLIPPPPSLPVVTLRLECGSAECSCGNRKRKGVGRGGGEISHKTKPNYWSCTLGIRILKFGDWENSNTFFLRIYINWAMKEEEYLKKGYNW